MSTDNTSEWVTISVPKRIAPAVYALIAHEMGGGLPAPIAQQGSTDRPLRASMTWSDDEIYRAVDESSPAMKSLLEKLALNAGEWVYAHQLAEALQTRVEHFGGTNKPEADWNNVAGTLGAFGHRVKSRYEKETWFTDNKGDTQGYWVHRMPRDVAEKVLARLEGEGS